MCGFSATAAEKLTPEEIKWLADHQELVFVHQEVYPPFEFTDNDHDHHGMCLDLVRWLSTEFGFHARFVGMPFQQAQEAVLSGDADVLTSLFYSVERDQRFDFTTQSWEVPASIFVLPKRPDIAMIEDLEGQTIAMQRGDYAEEFLRENGVNFTVLPTENFAEASDAVINGKADALIGDEQIVLYHLYGNDLEDRLKLVGEPLYFGSNRMAVKDGNEVLCGILTKGMELARERGVFDQLNRKWIGTGFEPHADWFAENRDWLTAVVIVLVLGGFLTFAHIGRLRAVVNDRTRELAASKDALALVLEGAELGSWEWDIVTSQIKVNEQWCRMLGLKPSEVKGELSEWSGRVHPDDLEFTMRALNDHLEGRAPLYESEHRMLHKSGKWVWFLDRGKVTRRDAKGRALYATGMHLDITKRKTYELAFNEQQKRFQALFDHSHDAICLCDKNGLVEINPRGCELFKCTREQLIGKMPWELAPKLQPDGRNSLDLGMELAMKTMAGKPQLFSWQHVASDGSTFDVDISLVRLDIGDEPLLLGVMRDTTERNQLEGQLRQSQKMEAVGQLAGGLAHDFNNLLQAINGYNELALSEIDPKHPSHALIGESLTAGQRAATLVSQLLAFSRRQIINPVELNVHDVLEDLVRMLTRLIGGHIELEYCPGPQMRSVTADRGMIDQVLMNLCVNARDAMPNGGKLTISTRMRVLDDLHREQYGLKNMGDYVEIEVRDTGVGIPQQLIGRIFEPFFSTKGKDKGTGLGLAMAYGIIRQHEGKILVESSEGLGTTFRVLLPAGQVSIMQLSQQQDPSGPVAGGSETILLAEDHEMVRSLARRILETAGYTVITASDGQQAIELFNEQPDNFDLLLFDVIMPRKSGRQAYEEITHLRPGIPTVFASGYSESAVDNNFILDEGFTLVQKPFDQATLLSAIRRVLDSSAESNSSSTA